VVDGGARRHRGGLLDTCQPHRPHRLAGAPIDGSFSVGALLLGLMVHMAMSVVFGVILAALVGHLGDTLPALLGVGMAFGLAVWLMDQYVLWPAIDQTAAQAFTPRGAGGRTPAVRPGYGRAGRPAAGPPRSGPAAPRLR
jgi:hypothetical protein